ncbi:MAG: carbohydrate ABC transporter permease, partial [Fervidobacterium sp.]
ALTFVAKKTQGLVLSVNDDPFYRGTLTVPLKGKTYTSTKIQDSFKEFLKQNSNLPVNFAIEEEEKNSPETFFEKVLLYYVFGSTPFFKRDEFIDGLLSSIEMQLDGIDTIQTFGIDRIENEQEKNRFSAFLEQKVLELSELYSKIQKFKAGTTIVLTVQELAEISTLLSKYNFQYDGKNEISENYNYSVMNNIQKFYDNIQFFGKVYNYFLSVQNEFTESDIVVIPRTNKERQELLLESVKDYKDYELIKNVVREKGLENLLEEFVKELDKNVEKRYSVTGATLSSLKTLINSIVSTAMEYQLDVKEELNGSFTNFMEKLNNVVGFNLTFASAKSKLESYAEEVENYDDLFKEIALNILEIQSLRMIYENSIYSWKIKSAPSFVKNVLVKEGKSIEIIMDGVNPVYFMDDNINKVEIKFTFSDVIKNIFQNYVLAWNAAPFGRYYFNTIFIAVTTTILEIIISSLAAYAFSWMNFPGKNVLFSIFLATMMVPGEVLLVPNFITVTKFGWIDTYYALIIPWVVSVFSIFLMRQHFMSLPSELFDAAKIDGCSHWRYLWQIVVPLSKPVVITSALLKFVGSWNAFLWVLIVTNSPKYRTLTVGLSTFSSEVGTLYNMLMAAATFSILPVVVIFLFTQKYFVRGIARTGLK